jgi:hypothetical protein
VPTIELDASGEETLMGRSGRSSTYQLSTNKLISRVHVRAAYVPADPPNPAKVELVCTGWNGVKIHCQGKAWELAKGDTFTSESQDADIMIDVQDARVLLQWPKAARKANTPATTDSSPEDENSPSRGGHGVVRRATFPSPLRARARLHSPVSPTPLVHDPLAGTAGGMLGSQAAELPPIQIYEDEPGHDDHVSGAATQPTQSTQRLTQPLGVNNDLPQHIVSDESDADEENDPLVHSFQATGENLLSRMASVRAGASPEQTRQHDLHYLSSPAKPTIDVSEPAFQPLVNHVVNQLAFARVASTPLSTILGNLPASLKDSDPLRSEAASLSPATLQAIIDATSCIGAVAREGKDAAGKPLESEYYYVPDHDFDESRRAAVVDRLQKPGLRNCRKSHKVGGRPSRAASLSTQC